MYFKRQVKWNVKGRGKVQLLLWCDSQQWDEHHGESSINQVQDNKNLVKHGFLCRIKNYFNRIIKIGKVILTLKN